MELANAEAGDREFALVDGGESAEDVSRLDWWRDWEGSSEGFGLSFPVGPFPRGGRLAGGRFSACRRQVFSSSSSDTLCSRACGERSTGARHGSRDRGTDLKVGGASSTECTLDVSGTVRRKIVVSFATSLGGHGGR
jgi:hypothetical protein